MAASKAIVQFRNQVWKYYKAHGRHDLAWRHTTDPYRIMVSEVMLQQTQVPRVVEKYKEFLASFPTVESLAKSDLGSVLKVWSGMGYNRRGKFLRDAAVTIVEKHGGKVPRDSAALRALPGIGTYTASAILIFAFNTPDTLIETNVRSAFIHGFFEANSVIHQKDKGPTIVKNSAKISDRELLPLIVQAAEGQDPRKWHWALMDYGSYLKKIHPNPSRQSAHYAKQSKFDGSLRQVRGAILRELHQGTLSQHALKGRLNLTNLPLKSGLQVKPLKGQIEKALEGLLKDKMIKKEKKKWKIA